MENPGDEAGVASGASTSLPSQKRQRAKQACEPCRLRKRRCDGALPCNMCSQFEYNCFYEKHPRKRSKLVEQHGIPDGSITTADYIKTELPTDPRQTLEDISKMQSMEANSGIAFTRLMGMRLDPSSGPKLFTFGFNLGIATSLVSSAQPITDFVDEKHMRELAEIYFESIHLVYGFLDKEWILENIALRWTQPDQCRVPDHLFCGLAALGILFARNEFLPILPRIVEAQKLALEGTTMVPPTLIDVQSWLLRVLYLRTSDHPHAVWIASCTTMHQVESCGLQHESTTSVLHPPANEGNHNIELRRRTFWTARMLNTWVSFEYGRTRVALRGITTGLPAAAENDYTSDYVSLYELSVCLDPETTEKSSQVTTWEDFLTRVHAFHSRHEAITLSKANLALCGYRRLRLVSPTISADATNKIIALGLGGLEAARKLAARRAPWWHVANVPFQTIAVFLAMDTRESLSQLGTAIRTLEYVVECFPNAGMKEALHTARFLIRLSKKKKDEDSAVLALTLKKGLTTTGVIHASPSANSSVTAHHTAATSSTDSTRQQSHHNPPAIDSSPRPGRFNFPADASNGNIGATGPPPQTSYPSTNETPKTATSEDWNMDVLNSDFDWNYFLTADMPAFNGFAPDGTM